MASKNRELITKWRNCAEERRKLAELLRSKGDEESLDRAADNELEADVFQMCAEDLERGRV